MTAFRRRNSFSGRCAFQWLLCLCALIILSIAHAAPPIVEPPDDIHAFPSSPTRYTPPPVIAIAGGGNHSLALKSDGTVWSWGDNSYGELGIGTFTGDENPTPKQVIGLPDIVAISAGGYFSLALDSDGTVWAWGENDHGELGNGTYTGNGGVRGYGIATPGQVSVLSEVVAISAGSYHSLVLKADGTVWSWGDNQFGELGNGAFTTTGSGGIATPDQVSGLSGVKTIAAGGESRGVEGGMAGFSLVLKSDGTVWAWGFNYYGQLGNGTFTTTGTGGIATPGQVSGLSEVVGIATGGDHSLALTSEGTVWAWGENDLGELGNGMFTTSSPPGIATPGPVVRLSGVKAIAAGWLLSLALKSDGTVWSWGDNSLDELGNGASTPYEIAIPGQVITLSGVKAIAAGSFHGLALKSNGTVWAWGCNFYGELGNGEIYPVEIPTPGQVIFFSN